MRAHRVDLGEEFTVRRAAEIIGAMRGSEATTSVARGPQPRATEMPEKDKTPCAARG